MGDAGRVIAGRARGRRLLAPSGGTRPLADRVKQTLFAILDPDLPGADVLDLFAGSGAGGIEALSRGARRAVFVERDAGAVAVVRENLVRCGVAAEGVIRRAEVGTYVETTAAGDGPFDIVLVDPPYADRDVLDRVLARLGDPEADAILRPGGRLVAKHFWRDAPPAVVGLLASERERRFGETALTFYRRREAGRDDAAGGDAAGDGAERGGVGSGGTGSGAAVEDDGYGGAEEGR